MIGYPKVAERIERLIRHRKLRAGDPLPSEREMAELLRVPYSTVRLANNHLSRKGTIHKHHGRGTFVAAARQKRQGKQLLHRLGLLYADTGDPSSSLSTYSQRLTFAIQTEAHRAGYEVLIEQLRTEELLDGKIPEMVRRRSVDAVLLDGPVRAHHVEFLEDHAMPYVVIGNCPLDVTIPQIRVNAERLVFEICRELFRAGYNPVWFDLDLPAADRWHTGMEMFRGYEAAVKQFGQKQCSLHLCPIDPKRMSDTVSMIRRAGMENAAVLVQNWSAPMLPSALAMHGCEPNGLLIVPMPFGTLNGVFGTGRVAEWSRYFRDEDLPAKAVQTLIPVLEGKTDQFHSLVQTPTCKLSRLEPLPRLELESHWKVLDAFGRESFGQGYIWRHLDGDHASKSVTDASTASESARQ